jgi:hypothetical protein
MSWFPDLSDLKGLTDKVQSALPKLDKEAFLQSLTLTTPELTAERERLDAEEKRKERVRNMLAGMLPWQTRDPERDILVEECKEAILNLSNVKSTFFGPYPMPPKGKDSDEDKESIKPSEESLNKLAKLEPLPPLLQNFDLQSHVGLVERLLIEDPKLVKMQSSLSGKKTIHGIVSRTYAFIRSRALILLRLARNVGTCKTGGGVRERVFWKNYFFHCAYTRYEAGLSIDEIWSELTEEERAPVIDTTSATTAASGGATVPSSQQSNQSPPASIGSLMEAISAQVSAMNEAPATETDVDETITFETTDVSGSVAHDAESTALFKPESASASSVKPVTKGPSESDFEMVGEDKLDTEIEDGAEDSPLGDEDYELDELEAEIARELED